MNKARRKILASIFADAAKLTLTAGILGTVISEEISLRAGLLLVILIIIFILCAYFITPKDNKD